MAADEYEPALALFLVLPRALVLALDDHVHALDYIATVLPAQRQDALQAQDVGALRLGEGMDPGEELVAIDLTRKQRDREHRPVVDGRKLVLRGRMRVRIVRTSRGAVVPVAEEVG